MRVPFSNGVQQIGSTDNVALIISKHPTQEIKYMAGATLEAVARWMVHHRLKLVANKTEAEMGKIVKESRYLYCQEVRDHAEVSLFKCRYFEKLKEEIASLLGR